MVGTKGELDQSLVPCRHEAGGDCPYPSCVTVCCEQGLGRRGEGEALDVRPDGLVVRHSQLGWAYREFESYPLRQISLVQLILEMVGGGEIGQVRQRFGDGAVDRVSAYPAQKSGEMAISLWAC